MLLSIAVVYIILVKKQLENALNETVVYILYALMAFYMDFFGHRDIHVWRIILF